MPSPIEDRIWQLCAQLATTRDQAEVERLLLELKKATNEYIHNIRTMSVKIIPRAFGPDRDAA